eukprot:4865643-Prymnesium_polylepis.1
MEEGARKAARKAAIASLNEGQAVHKPKARRRRRRRRRHTRRRRRRGQNADVDRCEWMWVR